MKRWTLIFITAVLTVGCDKPQPVEAPHTAGTTAPPAQPKTTWESASPDGLDATQTAQLDKAKAAQKALGTTLVKTLTEAVSLDGFAPSLEFCRGAAPNAAKQVSTSMGVKIGRTSHKLRNPRNTPPEWAADAVAAAQPGMKVFTGPDGALGVLSPIELSDLCVNCHGAPDALAEGVAEALKAQYPEDQATGFAPGDLRGWFWVEVPAG